MSNTAETPNRLHMNHGSDFKASFGAVCGAFAKPHVPGNGHNQEMVRVLFAYGLSLELTRATAIELARRLPEAVAALPIEPGADCGGAVWTGEGV
jgi:hypothetical protein